MNASFLTSSVQRIAQSLVLLHCLFGLTVSCASVPQPRLAGVWVANEITVDSISVLTPFLLSLRESHDAVIHQSALEGDFRFDSITQWDYNLLLNELTLRNGAAVVGTFEITTRGDSLLELVSHPDGLTIVLRRAPDQSFRDDIPREWRTRLSASLWHLNGAQMHRRIAFLENERFIVYDTAGRLTIGEWQLINFENMRFLLVQGNSDRLIFGPADKSGNNWAALTDRVGLSLVRSFGAVHPATLDSIVGCWKLKDVVDPVLFRRYTQHAAFPVEIVFSAQQTYKMNRYRPEGAGTWTSGSWNSLDSNIVVFDNLDGNYQDVVWIGLDEGLLKIGFVNGASSVYPLRYESVPCK